MLKSIISIHFVFFVVIISRSQTIETGLGWANPSAVSSQTSPDFPSVCGPINYTVSTSVNFKLHSVGAPYNNTGIIFPANTSAGGTTVPISITFNQPVENLRIRIVDLDEDVNNYGFVEEYLSEFNIMPASITNLGMGINPLFLTATEVTPNDGNNSNNNNDASGWLNWSAPVSVINFTYHRPGSLYGLIIDSIYFDCPGCNLSLDLGSDLSICNGGSASINGTTTNATNYLWNTGATTPNLTVNIAGSYILTVSNANCSVSDTVDVSEFTFNPDLLPEQDTICEGTNLNLTVASTFSSYLWSTNTATPGISVQNEGLYWVEVSNGECVHRDSITIVEIIQPEPLRDTTICQSSNAVINGFSPGVSAYLWSTGETTSVITVSTESDFTLQRTLYGCNFSDQLSVTFFEQPTSKNQRIRICYGETENLVAPNNGLSYLWSNGETAPVIQVDTTELLTLVTTTICGQVVDTFNVISEDCSCYIYLPNSFTPNGDEFNNGFGPVYECATDIFRLDIYNRWGEIIWESYDPDIKWDGTYRNKIVPDGIYTYKVKYSNKNSSEVLEITGHINVLR